MEFMTTVHLLTDRKSQCLHVLGAFLPSLQDLQYHGSTWRTSSLMQNK